MNAHLEGAYMRHPLIRRVGNHVHIILELRQAQNPIMIGGLFVRRNSEPLVVRVKRSIYGIVIMLGSKEPSKNY